LPPARRPPPRRSARPRERERPRDRRRPRERRGGGSDLLARILVAIPAAVLAVVFINLGGLPWALLLVVFGSVCMYELYRLLDRWKPVYVVGLAALAAMVLSARYGGQRQVLEVMVASVPVVFVAMLGRVHHGGATVAIAGTLFGILYIGMAFSHAELLRKLPHGDGVTIDVLLGTFLGDTGAYVGGRLFGRRALAPSISPGKTVEGLFCGVLIAILAVFLAGLFQNTWMTQTHALELGLAVAVLGPIVDLFESLVKRDAGTKDAGVLFGAHGGALDRLDAVLFTIVAGYYIWLGVVH
jgi:phosphatidate cytidylyltransferase